MNAIFSMWFSSQFFCSCFLLTAETSYVSQLFAGDARESRRTFRAEAIIIILNMLSRQAIAINFRRTVLCKYDSQRHKSHGNLKFSKFSTIWLAHHLDAEFRIAEKEFWPIAIFFAVLRSKTYSSQQTISQQAANLFFNIQPPGITVCKTHRRETDNITSSLP